ncbi:MAG: glycosyltransferase family 2 protein [Candidatus Cloacimonetes bacterium]|nr:glycosyltransferase family 2 protein [Candidatus Cloacimonadota bacterium]
MKTSIALCSYNGEKFIREQLESILNQTHPVDEIIICDDGSQDSTISILRDFENKYKSVIKVHQNRINLGFIKNFEKAISIASGEIIFLSDQDDIWKKDKIEKTLKVFDKNPDCYYVFSDAERIDEKGNKLEKSFWEELEFTPQKRLMFFKGFQKEILLKNNVVNGASTAIRSKFKQLLFPFSQLFPHDHWIALIFSFLDNKGGIPFDEPLISYRIHRKQALGFDRRTALQRKFSYLKNLKQNHKNVFIKQIEKLSEILFRIESSGNVPADNTEYLRELIFYLKTRNKMYDVKRKERMKLILDLAQNGYYRRFALSSLTLWKEILEKMILR